jgi:nucleotide-binding universal stress UspA family protein
MIKNILVAIDGSEHSRSALEHALWFAQRFDATLTGLHVIDIVSLEGPFLHDISGSLGFEPYIDFSSKLREVLEQRGQNLLQEFTERCQEVGVPVETASSIGLIANEICEHARTHDLVVIGRRGLNERFSTGLLGGTTESITRKCPKPVLVCPINFGGIERPLLAYDGSPRASGAMQLAADFCASTGFPLSVLHVAHDPASGEKVLAEAMRYLESYRLETSTNVISGAAPEEIVSAIGSERYDLLFIGAYGHSRIVEMVLGSTTEFVLRNASCPVFLSR